MQSPSLSQAEQVHSSNKERSKSVAKTANYSAQEIAAPLSIVELPERPSPDGGEDFTSAAQLDEETDNWSDWDLNDSQVLYFF